MKVIVFFALAAALASGQKLGKPLTLKEPVTLAALLANPDASVGKTVQVQGKVTEVCEMMGCWMNLTDADGHLLRIKVEDGDIVFPKAAIGKQAVAEGVLQKEEMSKEKLIEQMKHEAEENGRKFDPAKVKAGKTVYTIAGTGAVVLEK